MTKLRDHHSSSIVKLLYLGDSGTGKTGSLVSLVKAGYKLRILDTDNGVDVLSKFVAKECPDKMDNVDFEGDLRDKFKSSPTGPILRGPPKAHVKTIELLSKWSDGSDPSEWGPDHILVLDSLSTASQSAFYWAQGMNPSAKEPRTWYGVAQQSIEKVIDMLTSDSFKCNVIVITHIDVRENDQGLVKGYPKTIGAALNSILPKYFNNVVLAETTGMGKTTKRTIKTAPTGFIDLKTSAPFQFGEPLPLETGMATLFEKLKA